MEHFQWTKYLTNYTGRYFMPLCSVTTAILIRYATSRFISTINKYQEQRRVQSYRERTWKLGSTPLNSAFWTPSAVSDVGARSIRGIPAGYLWEHRNAAYCILSEHFTTRNWWWDFRLFSVVNYWWAVLHPLGLVKCSGEHRSMIGHPAAGLVRDLPISLQESIDSESRLKLTEVNNVRGSFSSAIYWAKGRNLKWSLSGLMYGPSRTEITSGLLTL